MNRKSEPDPSVPSLRSCRARMQGRDGNGAMESGAVAATQEDAGNDGPYGQRAGSDLGSSSSGARERAGSGVGIAGRSAAFTFLARGTRIAGKYEIVSLIGRGSVGAVYAAEELEAKRPVALKVLPLALARDEESRLRFELEAQLIMRIEDPHLVAVIDFGEIDAGLSYVVMERIVGRSLAAEMSVELEPKRAARIAQQICRALRAAHEAGIAHGDLRAANVLLVEEGDREQVKVLDVGIANLVAPEGSVEIHRRADLFALGELCKVLLSDRTGSFAERLRTRPPANVGEMEAAIAVHHMSPVIPGPAGRAGAVEKKPPLVAAVLVLVVLVLAVATAWQQLGGLMAGAPPMRTVEAMRAFAPGLVGPGGVAVQAIEIASEGDQSQIERVILEREAELVGCYTSVRGGEGETAEPLRLAFVGGAKQSMMVLAGNAGEEDLAQIMECVGALRPPVVLPLPADADNVVRVEIGPPARGM